MQHGKTYRWCQKSLCRLQDLNRGHQSLEVQRRNRINRKSVKWSSLSWSCRGKEEKQHLFTQFPHFRVQEDREKRKDLRHHLEKVGMDHSVVERLAPSVERGFQGTSEFDDDPYTTNVYVSNIPHSVSFEIWNCFRNLAICRSPKTICSSLSALSARWLH